MQGTVFLQDLFCSSCLSWLTYGEVNELLGWLSFWSNHTYCSSLLPPCQICALTATHPGSGGACWGMTQDARQHLSLTTAASSLILHQARTHFSLDFKDMNSSHVTISNYYQLTQETSEGNLPSVLPVALRKDPPIFLSKWAHMWRRN